MKKSMIRAFAVLGITVACVSYTQAEPNVVVFAQSIQSIQSDITDTIGLVQTTMTRFANLVQDIKRHVENLQNSSNAVLEDPVGTLNETLHYSAEATGAALRTVDINAIPEQANSKIQQALRSIQTKIDSINNRGQAIVDKFKSL